MQGRVGHSGGPVPDSHGVPYYADNSTRTIFSCICQECFGVNELLGDQRRKPFWVSKSSGKGGHARRILMPSMRPAALRSGFISASVKRTNRRAWGCTSPGAVAHLCREPGYPPEILGKRRSSVSMKTVKIGPNERLPPINKPTEVVSNSSKWSGIMPTNFGSIIPNSC